MVDFIQPNLLALISTIMVACAQSFYRGALKNANPATLTILANLHVSAFAAGLYLAEGGVDRWPWQGVLWFALAGILANFLSRYMYSVSYLYIGLARTQILAQSAPVWSALSAILLLGERVTLSVALGTGAIVWGASLIVQERREGESGRLPLVRYAVPILASMFFALAPTMRKLAFAWIPSAAFGMASANLAAALLQLVITPFVRGEAMRLRGGRKAYLAILSGALFNTAAAYLFWSSIKIGQVVQVVPIRRLSVLFVVLFAWLFFGRIERITKRVVAGALLSVAGAAAVGLGP